MDYSGPEAADLVDVHSLNVAFLELLAGSQGRRLRNDMPESLRCAVKALSDRQVRRLSAVPFLLISCGEKDDRYWREAANNQSVRDLFTPPTVDSDPLSQIACAALGFLWQLSRRNAYAARMVCGASLGWCEQLATRSLLDVFQRAAIDVQVLTPRLADDQVFWHRLLGAGLSSDAAIRRAAHLSALQTVLTNEIAVPARRIRSAACRTVVPAAEVREQLDE